MDNLKFKTVVILPDGDERDVVEFNNEEDGFYLDSIDIIGIGYERALANPLIQLRLGKCDDIWHFGNRLLTVGYTDPEIGEKHRKECLNKFKDYDIKYIVTIGSPDMSNEDVKYNSLVIGLKMNVARYGMKTYNPRIFNSVTDAQKFVNLIVGDLRFFVNNIVRKKVTISSIIDEAKKIFGNDSCTVNIIYIILIHYYDFNKYDISLTDEALINTCKIETIVVKRTEEK